MGISSCNRHKAKRPTLPILLMGQCHAAGKELVSRVSESDQSTGIFQLKMQTDGNLVQSQCKTRTRHEYCYWTSWIDRKGDNVSLCLVDDGHLYLLSSAGTNIKNLTQDGYPTKDKLYLMRIDADGIFRLYSQFWELDLQVLAGGIGAQAAKGISLQKVAKAKTYMNYTMETGSNTLICCGNNKDWNLPEEKEAILEEWTYHCFKAHELGKLVSAKDVDKRQLERMVKVGLWCILDDPSLHPSIKKVLLMLEGTV
nr:g-type lectin s-receptor-like serine/threonine-protein kinase lecrk2 [Quercus suber]